MIIEQEELKHLAARIKFKNIFGCHQIPLHKNAYCADQSFIFTNGCYIIIANVISSRQEAIMWTEESRQISAFYCLYSPLTFFIASQSKGIYQLKVIIKENMSNTEMIFRMSEPGFEIFDLAFFQNKYIVMASRSNGQYRLEVFVLGDISPQQVLLFQPFKRILQVGQLLILLSDHSYLVIQRIEGDEEYKVVEPQLFPQEILKQVTFISQFDIRRKSQVILTSRRLICMNSPQAEFQFDSQPSCLISYGSNIMVGFKNKLAVQIVSLVADNFINKFYYNIDSSKYGGICSLSYFQSNQYVAITVAQSVIKEDQMWQYLKNNNWRINLLALKLSVCQTFKKLHVNPFTRITRNHIHRGQIVKLEKNNGKNYMLSMSSSDRAISLFNFSWSNPKIQSIFTFAQQPTSFSLHPLSTCLAVGFRDSLKIFLLLFEPILLYKQAFPINLVQYSPSGNKLVAISGSLVLIYNSTTFAKQQMVIGTSQPISLHFQNHMFKYSQILKIPAGNPLFQHQKIVISSSNRSYYCDIVQRKKLQLVTCNIMEKRAMEVRYEPIKSLEIIAFHEPKIWVGYKGQVIYQATLKDVMSQIFFCYEIGLMVIGTANGYIRLEKWPIQIDIPPEQIKVLDCKITAISVSSDINYLILGGADGTVAFFELSVSIEDLKAIIKPPSSNFQQFQLCYQPFQRSKQALIVQKAEIKKSIVSVVDQNLELKLQQLKKQISDHQKQTFENFQADIKKRRSKIVSFEKNYKSRVGALQKQLIELEESNKTQVLQIYSKHQSTLHALKALKIQNNAELQKKKQHSLTLQDQLQKEFEVRLDTIQQKLNRLRQTHNKNLEGLKCINKQRQQMKKQIGLKKKRELLSQQRAEELRNIQINQNSSKLRREKLKLATKEDFLEFTDKDLSKHTAVLLQQKQRFINYKNFYQAQIKSNQVVIQRLQQLLKKHRTQNINLTNVQEVYNDVLDNLEQQRGPLNVYYQHLFKHIEAVSQHLQNVNKRNSILIKKIDHLQRKKSNLEEILSQRKKPMNYSKRQIFLLSVELNLAFLKGQDTWIPRIKEIHEEFNVKKYNFLKLIIQQCQIEQKYGFVLQDDKKGVIEPDFESVQQNLRNMVKYRQKLKVNFKFYQNQCINQRKLLYFKVQNFNDSLLSEIHMLKLDIAQKKLRLEKISKKIKFQKLFKKQRNTLNQKQFKLNAKNISSQTLFKFKPITAQLIKEKEQHQISIQKSRFVSKQVTIRDILTRVQQTRQRNDMIKSVQKASRLLITQPFDF